MLWALLVIANLAIIPYSQTIAAGAGAHTSSSAVYFQTSPLIGAVINSLAFAPLLALGLFLAGRAGLGAPILSGWLRGEPVRERLRATFWPSIAIGLGASATLALMAEYVFGPPLNAEIARLKITLVAGGHPPAWQGFLAAFNGSISEELMLRLVVLSTLAWLGGRLFHTVDGRPTLAVLWVATFLSATLFAVAHLPAAAAIGLPMDALVITRTLTLNALAGIVFGWLYWKRGLESAILAHFCSDIVVAVIAPLVFANWIR